MAKRSVLESERTRQIRVEPSAYAIRVKSVEKRKRGSRSIITDASVTVVGGGVVLERR
ncbi:hypothetical protein MTR_5g006795 [Medicago truncatula]|uniref:Uncharacterized protein n=1 Tax=Medicago truncatula TaxID=3880 RepID=A0A072UC60_MEDTR|nr:hypothetical protein MTR_5g006795 [Medicago truncatula]